MTLSAAEQYLLELINRARLDPEAEAARFGIDLNANLPAGTLTGGSRQVLAPDALLEQAATDHSLWMILSDVFSHTGVSGSQPWDRAATAGYRYSTIGENIAFSGTTGASFDLIAMIEGHHEGLFLSAGHRVNLLNDGFREIGLGRETGAFTYQGTTYTASLLTELFGTSGSEVFLTGVAYDDLDGDGFYTAGEGRGGIVLSANGQTGVSAAAGGYALGLARNAATQVTGTVGQTQFDLLVDLSQGNVKLDVVGGDLLLTSGQIVLGLGIDNARLLGTDDLALTGSAAGNDLFGNKAGNLILGLGGNDMIRGGKGGDRLEGGDGTDRLFGDAGRDLLAGNAGHDMLSGGNGDDRLYGDAGNDTLTGGGGADRFIFKPRSEDDVITDFDRSEGDTLTLNANYWRGQDLTGAEVLDHYASVIQGDVLFDFGSLGTIRLDGIGSLDGLANALIIG